MFFRRTIFLVLFIGFFLSQGKGQGSVVFHGKNTLQYHYAGRRGLYSSLPVSYFTNEFSGTLNVFGMPVNGISYFSTAPENSNLFRFSLRASPSRFIDAFSQNTPTFVRKFLGAFETLELGNTHPDYGILVLQHTSVRGVNIAVNPGVFYAAFVTGTVTHDLHKFYRTHINQPKTRIYYGGFGIGDRRESYLHFSFLSARDEGRGEVEEYRLRDNVVIGASGGLSFFQNRWKTEVEGAFSVYTRDRTVPGLDEYLPIPFTFPDGLLKINASTMGDVAFKVSSRLRLKNLSMDAQIRRTGAGYHTLGNPYLRNDLLLADGRVAYKFLKNRLSLSGFFKHQYDDLAGWKDYRTTLSSAGLSVAWRNAKQPWVVLNWSPWTQYADHPTKKIKAETSHFSMLSGYAYTIKNIRASTTISYTRLITSRIIDTTFFGLRSNSFSLAQSMRLNRKLSMNGSVNLSYRDIADKNRSVYTYNIQCQYGERDGWQNRLRLSYSTLESSGDKLRIHYTTSLKVLKWLKLEGSVVRNDYFRFLSSSRLENDWIILTSVVFTW